MTLFLTEFLFFSPKGDAYDLPEGATPVDFAYAVHSQLGDQVIGAKVNGKMVPLDYHLKSGEVVEILVNKNKKSPSADWLDFVVTRQAKKKISQKLRYNLERLKDANGRE